MDTPTLVALGVAAVALVAVVVLAFTLAGVRRTLEWTRADLARLEGAQRVAAARIDDLTGQLVRATTRFEPEPAPAPEPATSRASAPARVEETAAAERAEFLITTAGDRQEAEPSEPISTRLVLGAGVGESMLKVAAFGSGVRRAMAGETRNRIRYAMKREVRRARKTRRREMRDAWLRARAEGVG